MGTTVACPLCTKSFAIPGRYNPVVDPSLAPTPAPDQVVAPPAPKQAALKQEIPPVSEPTADSRPTTPPPGLVTPPVGVHSETASPTPTGLYTQACNVTLSPHVIDWIPVVCFTLILLLTFFSWVGIYPGGYKAYSQSPWLAVSGSISTDRFAEEVLKKEGDLKLLTTSNWILLVPYLIGVLLTTALAWADRFVTMAHVQTLTGKLTFLSQLWPHRFPLLAGLSIALLVLLLLQLQVGFGLEHAVKQMATEKFAGQREAAGTNSAALDKVTVKEGQEIGMYQPQGTYYLSLVVIAHIVVVLAAAARFWLYRRGTKPLPKLTMNW